MKQLMIWTLLAILTAGQGADRAEVQLQAAIKKETFDGDLKGAIEQYKKLADSSNRAVAAKALVRMGECYEKLYEKLGDAEARKAYERVVRDFADQKDALAAARQHLAANSAQSEAGVVVQRIAAFPDNRRYTSISRDGRYLAFTKADGIYVHDLVKSEERRIVAKNPQEDSLFSVDLFPDGRRVAYVKVIGKYSNFRRSELYVIGADGANEVLLFSRTSSGKDGEILYAPAISPDGKQVACEVSHPGDDYRDNIYLLDTGGSKPRLLFSGEKNEYLADIEWAPDGKHLLAGFYNDSPGSSRLVLVSVADGSSRVVGAPTEYGLFSPDGRYIAFYQYPYPDLNTKIDEGPFVTPVEVGKKVLLVRGTASDPIWTTDGKRILFRNQRPDQSDPRNQNANVAREPYDTYSIRVVDGAPDGKPELLKKDMVSPRRLIGVTQDGTFYYSTTTRESANVYVVDLNSATGKAVSKPARLNKTFVDSSAGPAMWSPDGQLLVYCKETGPITVMLRSAGTGEERALTVIPPFGSANAGYPVQWFPDGRSILVRDQEKGRLVFRKVDAQSGKQQPFFDWRGEETLHTAPVVSLDGKFLFFVIGKPDAGQSAGPNVLALNTVRLMRRNLESGEDKEMYQVKSPGMHFTVLTLSKDGRQLAFMRSNTDKTASLLTISIDGGDPVELYRSNLLLGTRTWTKDGMYILVVQSDPKSGLTQFWSVPTRGGEPIPTGVLFATIGLADFHPDGKRLTYIGRQPGQTELWVMKLLPPGAKPSGK